MCTTDFSPCFQPFGLYQTAQPEYRLGSFEPYRFITSLLIEPKSVAPLCLDDPVLSLLVFDDMDGRRSAIERGFSTKILYDFKPTIPDADPLGFNAVVQVLLPFAQRFPCRCLINLDGLVDPLIRVWCACH